MQISFIIAITIAFILSLFYSKRIKEEIKNNRKYIIISLVLFSLPLIYINFIFLYLLFLPFFYPEYLKYISFILFLILSNLIILPNYSIIFIILYTIFINFLGQK